MCAHKLKQVGCCCYGYKVTLVSYAKHHSSASDNNKRAISVTLHELLLLRGLSRAALTFKRSQQWAGVLCCWFAVLGKDGNVHCLNVFFFPVSLGIQFQEAVSLFPLSSGHLEVVTFSNTANPVELLIHADKAAPIQGFFLPHFCWQKVGPPASGICLGFLWTHSG